MMTADSSITLNGKAHPLETATTVAALLKTLGLEDKPVVVELDGEALTRSEHSNAEVKPGARLEVITLAAGG